MVGGEREGGRLREGCEEKSLRFPRRLLPHSSSSSSSLPLLVLAARLQKVYCLHFFLAPPCSLWALQLLAGYSHGRHRLCQRVGYLPQTRPKLVHGLGPARAGRYLLI